MEGAYTTENNRKPNFERSISKNLYQTHIAYMVQGSSIKNTVGVSDSAGQSF